MRTLTSVDAQNRFGELLDTAQREPAEITRRGRTVAAFRGSGSGGGAGRLVEDRQLERAAKQPLPAATRCGTRRA